MKPRIVLSGVNLVDMGPLTVFREAIASLAERYSDKYDIFAVVHRKSLFSTPGVTYIEFPNIKSSWFKRMRFEYLECRRISAEIKPHLWFAMHDMTPYVTAKTKAVYCHNPSPFYPFRLTEALLDWKFGTFILLYRFLYRINITSNDFVVVQQDWIRSEFQRRYSVCKVVVSHPSIENSSIPIEAVAPNRSDSPWIFFYPAFPRTFKNIEQVLNAVKYLERAGFDRFAVWLTLDGTENSYAAKLRREFSGLRTINWLGLLPHSEIIRRYRLADCLIFPSKLETWGMPITEFKATGKPILAADLAYAHETVGDYERACFFKTGDAGELAAQMRQAVLGEPVFQPAIAQTIAAPFSRNWEELWEILLQGDRRS